MEYGSPSKGIEVVGLSIRVKEVNSIGVMLLNVTFENGIQKRYDVRQLLPQFPISKALEDAALFNLVQVDCGGCAITWNADIDISACELWENGEMLPM